MRNRCWGKREKMYDWRNIKNGFEIPNEGYCDQPYVVITDEDNWLCVITTGKGTEGEQGQHIISTISTDYGKTWSNPVDIEPASGPESSYAVLLKVPGGRIYCFYNHNTDNLREVIADDPPFEGGVCKRVDTLGYFVFKYSDDCGHSWSSKRYIIPVREMAIDRENPYRGKVRFFWNVGKPFIHQDAAYVPLHKVGGFGYGFVTRSEGVLLKSKNILTERIPENITWETLPDGDIGLRTPPGGGPIAEEQSCVVLSDNSFYCVYRSIDGHPVFTYSRDSGHTWAEPRYMRYADGRLMKHPRAANFVWKYSNRKYLYWFHNHGGKGYEGRNPAWLCGGVEIDTPEGKTIQWSQPEIVLYDDNPDTRISYPDFIEANGNYFLTETQKSVARVHKINPDLLEGLWGQFKQKTLATDGLVLNLPENGEIMSGEIDMPNLSQGFSIDMWISFNSFRTQQILVDNRTENGKGLCLRTTLKKTLEIVLNDGRTENCWDCDPNLLKENKLHYVAIIVDGGSKIISFVIDGKLCDGGEYRQFGWGRFTANLREINGPNKIKICPSLDGKLNRLRIYNRYLRISEIIGNWNAE